MPFIAVNKLHVLGRLFFVLFFLSSGWDQLFNPEKTLSYHSDRYQRFEAFLNQTHQTPLPKTLTFSSLEPSFPIIIQLLGLSSIFFSLGVISFHEVFGLGIFIQMLVTITVLKNPWYFESKSDDFYRECEESILSVGLMGLGLMFAWRNKRRCTKSHQFKKS